MSILFRTTQTQWNSPRVGSGLIAHTNTGGSHPDDALTSMAKHHKSLYYVTFLTDFAYIYRKHSLTILNMN